MSSDDDDDDDDDDDIDDIENDVNHDAICCRYR